MEDAAHGYYTATNYVKGIHLAYDPRRIAAVARAGGHPAPDPFRPFAYADFGCGFGLTVLLLAMLFPRSQFFGIDLMQDHIDSARRNAEALGLDNVTFINAAFGDLTPDDLPPLDFAVAHGVISWISPQVRAQLARAVASRLKPNGIFDVSYNLYAGWSQILPYREMFKASVDAGADDEAALRVIRAIAIAHGREQTGAAGEAQPAEARLPQVMRSFLGGDINYIRHEFLNEYWTCFTNRQVADEMADAGLHFAGPWLAGATLVPVAERPLPIEDPIYWEDYFSLRANRTFRTTHFVTGAAPDPMTTPAQPQIGGALTLSPVANPAQSGLYQRSFPEGVPHGAVSVADFTGNPASGAERREAARALSMRSTVFLHHEMQPAAPFGAFRLRDAGRENLSVMAMLEPGAPHLLAREAGMICPMPMRMWQVLTTCAGQPVEKFAEILDARFPEAAQLQPTHLTVANWQSRWAPWLAGMGLIAPI